VQLTFTKTGKKHNWVRAVRHDGSEVSFPWPDTGGSPPHDLVHGIVERAFGLRSGFWGLVDDGLDVAQVQQAAVRATHGLLERLGRDPTELGQAEALVGYFSSRLYAGELDAGTRAELLRSMFEPWRVPLPASFDETSERRVLDELHAWMQRWHALPPGASLVFDTH
jgi:hypothetical protein